jgi:hypothetical protein
MIQENELGNVKSWSGEFGELVDNENDKLGDVKSWSGEFGLTDFQHLLSKYKLDNKAQLEINEEQMKLKFKEQFPSLSFDCLERHTCCELLSDMYFHDKTSVKLKIFKWNYLTKTWTKKY